MEAVEVGSTSNSTHAGNSRLVDPRRHGRFKLEASICVYARGTPVVRGHTVDISESGISAILRDEVPLNEMVRLAFSVADGDIEIHALVRQRNAFRYGFQFMEGGAASALIRRTCSELSLQASLRESSKP
ncbi:MAG: PilZ domain-containing protein [Candidatus Sulfotelmatobacter sp.]